MLLKSNQGYYAVVRGLPISLIIRHQTIDPSLIVNHSKNGAMVGIEIKIDNTEDSIISMITGLICKAYEAFSGERSEANPHYIEGRLRVMLRADTAVSFTPVIYGLNVEFVS